MNTMSIHQIRTLSQEDLGIQTEYVCQRIRNSLSRERFDYKNQTLPEEDRFTRSMTPSDNATEI